MTSPIQTDSEQLCAFAAKNIVLAGVKVGHVSSAVSQGNVFVLPMLHLNLCAQAVTLHDTKQCDTSDLGSNFFIFKEDVLSQRRR